MSKPSLVILSDIFGASSDTWMDEYRNLLSPYLEIIEYDSRILAEISDDNLEKVHAEFIHGGIERAVQNLLRLESRSSMILGFSIGGTIAWKFALENKHVESIHCVSATRLRKEENKPASEINLYFGEFETNGPSEIWFNKLAIVPAIFDNETHECYKSIKPTREVCSKMLLESN